MSKTNRDEKTSNRLTRGDFLARAGGAVLAPLVLAAGCQSRQTASRPYRWKGRKNSNVNRWDVITIGNLSRNRYWGESDAKALRAAICTCTLIRGEGFRVLVDPSLADEAAMATELDRRTGVKPDQITAVFITHEHGDHIAGLAHFPQAKWLATPAVAETLNKSKKLPRAVEGAPSRLFDALDVIPTPGHTETHHSLGFDCDGLAVVVAGDAVPTRDFFDERRGYYNAVDFERSARTMDALAAKADIIVPGHDNYFLTDCIE